jgi:parallel beta-helix repeat protein
VFHNSARDQGKSGRGTVEPRKRRRWRMRPTVVVLEDRHLLSTFTVTNNASSGAGSLPCEIGLANTAGGANTIVFGSFFNTPQTINLGGAQLELSTANESVTITGPAGGVTVSGAGASRVFQVDSGVIATISGLTITGGNTTGSGAGLANFGTTTLNNCTASGNSAPFGAGLYNSFGSLTLTNCTVSGNSATSGGGGIASFGAGSTTTLTNCTLSGNSAGYGGGLYTRNYGAATLTNCTVSGNSANEGQLCGGLYSGYGASTITLGNTIVAGNTPHDVGTYSGGVFISNGNNLVGATNGTSGWVSSDLTGTSAQPLNPVLAPLGNYGGPIQTMALLPGSPAIDAGSNALIPAGATTDQRGLSRIVNGVVDIGAFESEGFNFTVVPGGTPQTATIGTPFTNPLAVSVTANNPLEPVNGGLVAFVANPASNGAAAAFVSASPAVIANGQAAVTAAPNNMDGNYPVVATSTGFSTTFDLTNAGPVFAHLIVNSTSPSLFPGAGLLSLPEAILFADLDRSGNSNITFSSTVFATPQTITLTGNQLQLSNTVETETITGPAAGVTVSGCGLSRVFQVDGLVTASISGLTIADGTTTGNGGGLYNLGTTTLNNCTISGSTAYNGGGLANGGTLTMTNCTVSGNSARGYLFGAGGLYNGGTLTMTNCTVSGNSDTGFNGCAGVANGTFSNQGPTLTLTNCTITANSAGIHPVEGGLLAGGPATLTNTIVAGNEGGEGDIYAYSLSGTNNLIGTGNAGGLANGVNGNLVGVTSPLLAPLGNYGGPTQTVALLPGSPAINAGTNGPGIPTTDQRGLGRVGAVDIGAFESQGFTGLTLVAGSTPQTAKIGTGFPNPLALKVTANNPVEPVDGGVVTLVAEPATSGATAFLSATAAVIAGGQVVVTAAPNNMDGSYQVVASANGTLPATFNLTNTGPALTHLVVNTTSVSLSPGAGLFSLPLAVDFANSDRSGIANITFDKNVFKTPQTITLAGTQLELSNTSETETITGPAAGVTVSGGGLSRVFQVDGLVTASISGLTITGGKTAGNGGGVQNYGSLTLSNCRVNGNSLTSNPYGQTAGGGLYNGGTLTLTNCTVSGNSAPIGGGVANGRFSNQGQMLTMTNSTVSDNSASNPAFGGGGVRNAGTATLSNCNLSGNTGSYGGGLYNFAGATVTLANCIVSGNSAKGGGGVFNFARGTITLTNSSLTDNSASGGIGSIYFGGGGIQNTGFATITLTNCTVSGNSSNNSGGGVMNAYGSTATLSNCTVSGNSANGNGGGLSNLGVNGTAPTMTLSSSTVSGNSAVAGGGLFNQGTLTVASSNISSNRAHGGAGGNGIGGGICSSGGSVALSSSALTANTATGGAGASGQAGGDGIGGGLALENDSTATITNTSFLGNLAQGGAGGAGANGGDGIGGGIAVAIGGASDASSVSLSNSLLSLNVAQGGKGGSGANGGNGWGGGVFVGVAGSAALDQADVILNLALGGLPGAGGSAGDGIGGGLYVTAGGVVTLKKTTVALNFASFSNANIYGTVSYL